MAGSALVPWKAGPSTSSGTRRTKACWPWRSRWPWTTTWSDGSAVCGHGPGVLANPARMSGSVHRPDHWRSLVSSVQGPPSGRKPTGQSGQSSTLPGPCDCGRILARHHSALVHRVGIPVRCPTAPQKARGPRRQDGRRVQRNQAAMGRRPHLPLNQPSVAACDT
jgi:hypothetical protein